MGSSDHFGPALGQARTELPRSSPAVEVYFSPNGGCTDAVVVQLQAAQETVLVQAYSFTSAPIAKALVDAHKRGVRIQVILDEGQRTEKYSSATFLNNAGIPTFIDAAHAIAHNKVIVIDGQVVITGSFNLGTIEDTQTLAAMAPPLKVRLRNEIAHSGRARCRAQA